MTALTTHRLQRGMSQLSAQPRMKCTFQVQEQTRIRGCVYPRQQVTPCPADRGDQTSSNRVAHFTLSWALCWERRDLIFQNICMQVAPCEERRSLQDTARVGRVSVTTSGTIRISLPWSQTRVMCPWKANDQVSKKGLATS